MGDDEEGVRPASVRAPSMADVAEHAGVSHQTVSRVLNDHPNVRPETRTRVLEAIEQLGYRRNSAARALATNRSGIFGVVSTGSALHGPSSTAIGIELAAREAGYYVSVATVTRFDPASMRHVMEHFLGQGVEGIIMIAPQVDATRAVVSLAAPVPVVMISSTGIREGAPGPGMIRSVSVDQVAGATAVTEHLIGLGHEQVVHLAGPQDWFDARARVAGWRAAVERAGLAMADPIPGDWTAERGYSAGRRMVRDGLPTAVFAANDQLALGMLRAFWEAGVRVPADVSVAGFDDATGAAHFIPPLTTVRQDFQALGRLAIDAMRTMLAGREPVVTPLRPTLQVRMSTAPPRA